MVEVSYPPCFLRISVTYQMLRDCAGGVTIRLRRTAGDGALTVVSLERVSGRLPLDLSLLARCLRAAVLLLLFSLVFSLLHLPSSPLASRRLLFAALFLFFIFCFASVVLLCVVIVPSPPVSAFSCSHCIQRTPTYYRLLLFVSRPRPIAFFSI